MAQLLEREKRMKAALAKLGREKEAARDKMTGKAKAKAYVRLWLEKLTMTELKHECEMRGFRYGEFDTMEQAMDTVVAAMFAGVVVQQVAAPKEEVVQQSHVILEEYEMDI